MIDDSKYASAFELVSMAGDAKSAAYEAIKLARAGSFDEARKMVTSSMEKMTAAHEHQVGMVRQEISGEPVELNIIMVHAQDHLVMATVMRDMAEELIAVYEAIAKLRGQLG